MGVSSDTIATNVKSLRQRLMAYWEPYSAVPLLGWLLSLLAAAVVEQLVGTPLARAVGMSKAPVLFGLVIALDKPVLIPSALLYVVVIYLLPIGIVARASRSLMNRAAAKLLDYRLVVSALIHLGLLYLVLHLWSGMNDYRLLIATFTLIGIITTLSLNVVNGYMGEFSCSHPGFMALGAYASSVFTLLLFSQDKAFGAPILPPLLGPYLFPIALIVGGIVAAVGSLLVAIPSFRTRGDYLAIISLAFMFIVKSLIENLEVVGGARGLQGQPKWASLPIVFLWTAACVWIINNFVRSIMGKSLNAVRDGELAANAMTVDTRRIKMVAFMFAAFWAGIAGGLLAHVLSYVNPGTFDLKRLAEVLAMLYLGGLNSVQGSIVGAVGFNLLSEALRPLEIYKWLIIPLLLILLMIFRPTGLIAFKEFDIERMLQPRDGSREEVEDAAASS